MLMNTAPACSPTCSQNIMNSLTITQEEYLQTTPYGEHTCRKYSHSAHKIKYEVHVWRWIPVTYDYNEVWVTHSLSLLLYVNIDKSLKYKFLDLFSELH